MNSFLIVIITDNNDEIRKSIYQTHVYSLLHKSFIFIQGKVEDKTKVKFWINDLSFFFFWSNTI